MSTQSDPKLSKLPSERLRALNRMRLIASGLLAVMVVILAAAHWGMAYYPWLSYLRAFAEAALVGGCADWFAVTALFRHPFGLPIPHTAIIPRKKDRIGDSVGDFIANNFLSPDVLLPKITAADPARRVGEWLADPTHAQLAARRLTSALPALADALGDEPAGSLLRDAAITRLRRIPAAPLLARVLTTLVAGNQHLTLFDLGLDAGQGFILDHQDSIRQTVNEKSRWWVPEWLDEKLTKRIISGALSLVEEMRADDHPWRLNFQDSVASLIERLAHSSELHKQAEALKDDIIAHPEVQAYLASLWRQLKESAFADMAENGRLERATSQTLTSFASRLANDEALRNWLNRKISRAIALAVVPNRQRIGRFIAGVVHGWEAETLVDKLELQVGRDLQYIRINGTVVGGMVGLVIHALTAAL